MNTSITTIQRAGKMIIVLAPIVLLSWLTVRYTAFFGELVVSTDFSGSPSAVGVWEPAGRALDAAQNIRTKESYQLIVGEPVYLPVKVPRSFNSVEVEVEYSNDEQSLIEFGLVTSEDPFAVRLYPFEHTVIDEALQTWPSVIESNGLTLLQRQPVYESMDEFMAHPPTDAGVGLYRTSLSVPYIDTTYTATAAGTSVDRLLRGPHTFVTYIDSEPLHVEFDLVDMNRQFDDDTVTIQVLEGDTIIREQQLADDGVTAATGQASGTRTMEVDVTNLPAGAYTIKLTGSTDVIIQHIRSQQEKFVVERSLYLINNEEYAEVIPGIDTSATHLVTNATELLARTERTTGVQRIHIGGDTLDVATPSTPYWWSANQPDTTPALQEVEVPKNAVELTTNGYIAFSAESFFDPDYLIQSISGETDLVTLDALLYRDYTPPTEETKGKKQTVQMSLDGIAGDRKSLLFVLSAPGLDREKNIVRVDSVRMRFSRDPLYKKLFK